MGCVNLVTLSSQQAKTAIYVCFCSAFCFFKQFHQGEYLSCTCNADMHLFAGCRWGASLMASSGTYFMTNHHRVNLQPHASLTQINFCWDALVKAHPTNSINPQLKLYADGNPALLSYYVDEHIGCSTFPISTLVANSHKKWVNKGAIPNHQKGIVYSCLAQQLLE